jgi:hypothetical protein
VADDAQRGVTFTLKANVDPSAKAEIDKLTNELTKAQTDLASASASASQQASAAAASAASVAEATAKATIDKLKQDLEDLHKTIVAQTASIAQQSSAASQASQGEAASASQAIADKINDANSKVVQEQEKSAKEIMDSWMQSYDQTAEAAKQSSAESIATVNQTSETIAERIKRLEGEKAEIRKISADKERAEYVHAQLALVEITQRRIEAEEKARLAAEKGSSKAGMDPMFLAQDLAAEELKIAEEVAAKKKVFIEAEKKEKAFLVDQELKGLKSIEAEQERAVASAARRNQQLSSSAGRIVSAFSEGSEALMRFVNGIQHLGLIGEKDLQKVQDAILRIQGTTQIFTGLIRMFRQASEGMDAYRRMVELTSQAHAVSAAAATADTAATELNTAAVVQNGAARSVANGGMMARAATGAANIGTSLINAGAVVGLEAGASALSVFAAAVAAVSGALFAAVSVIQVFKESLTFGFGGGAGKGSYTATIGASSYNPFQRIYAQGQMFETETPVLRELAKLIPSMQGIRTGVGMAMDFTGVFGINKQTSLEKEQVDAAKMEKARQDFREHNLKLQVEAEREIKQITSERQSIVVKQHAAEQDAHRARMQSVKQEDQRAALIKEIATIEHNQTIEAEDRARKVIALQRERLTVEKEINREQTQAAKEQLRNLEEQSKVKEREYEKARTEAMSAAERFGLLTTEEQQTIVDIQRRFRAGAGGVETEELKKIRGFSGALDEQISAEARRRAAAAGFGAFQTEDLRKIQQLEQERQQLEVKVKAQADVVAKLEIDIDATAREINKQISAQFKIILEEMAKQIVELQGKQTTIENRMINRFGGRVQQ